MAIDLSDTRDPHHSLLYKPEVNTDADLDYGEEMIESIETTGEVEEDQNPLPKNPPMSKDDVIWWGKHRK